MATNNYQKHVYIDSVNRTADVISYQIEIGRRGAGDAFDPPNARITLNGQVTIDQLAEVNIYVKSGPKASRTRFLGWVTDVDIGLYTTTVIAVSKTYSLMSLKTVDGAAANSPQTFKTPVYLMQYGQTYAAGAGVPTPSFYYRNTTNWFSAQNVTTTSWTDGEFTVAAWFDKWTGCLPDSRWYINEQDQVIFENGNWRGNAALNPSVTLQASWVEQSVTSGTLLNDRSGKTEIVDNTFGASLIASTNSSHPRFLQNIPSHVIDTWWGLAPIGVQTWSDHAQAVSDSVENSRLSQIVIPIQHLNQTDADYIYENCFISTPIDTTNIAALLPVGGDLIIEGWTESVQEDGYWTVSYWMSYAELTRPPQAWQEVTTTTQWNQVSNTITWADELTNWI